MKNLKKCILKKSMKVVSSLSLRVAESVLATTCAACGHQPKCPDELLK
ncbi:cyclic lactone autoinducer peptide [Clostridium coskatii]|uniref:Cyclic lactone autoinducer peptide n=1 Tax=Clostridium coskatii TaxID=1705578 RepID=A0A166RRG5_9CLOT|nr:cyclic lactone autoinducer peptide [Clostridium coskatii]OAA91031.1 hypothetical protein WX73_01943 [Clostridium coskatii]OBR97072.1 hypothetical protein CLCOS_06660 [Clostridium coskatii]